VVVVRLSRRTVTDILHCINIYDLQSHLMA
jgi:hypothetical protein